jgi:hypothetical protein
LNKRAEGFLSARFFAIGGGTGLLAGNVIQRMIQM